MKKDSIYTIYLQNWPIFHQLQLEEALLRADERNWCIISEGTSPAIVMGISGKAEIFIDLEFLRNYPIPVIQRFSGGGTVIVDENTFFVTFIINSSSLEIPSFPEKVHLWAEKIYYPVFKDLDFFFLENDYVIGNKKCGGNAQYFRKDRFLHHTSFLWNFESERMNYLLMPQRKPKYRKERNHSEFLCKLSDHFSCKKKFTKDLIESLSSYFFIEENHSSEIGKLMETPHRKSTTLIKI
jgi:lipoate---protein ligase